MPFDKAELFCKIEPQITALNKLGLTTSLLMNLPVEKIELFVNNISDVGSLITKQISMDSLVNMPTEKSEFLINNVSKLSTLNYYEVSTTLLVAMPLEKLQLVIENIDNIIKLKNHGFYTSQYIDMDYEKLQLFFETDMFIKNSNIIKSFDQANVALSDLVSVYNKDHELFSLILDKKEKLLDILSSKEINFDDISKSNIAQIKYLLDGKIAIRDFKTFIDCNCNNHIQSAPSISEGRRNWRDDVDPRGRNAINTSRER